MIWLVGLIAFAVVFGSAAAQALLGAILRTGIGLVGVALVVIVLLLLLNLHPSPVSGPPTPEMSSIEPWMVYGIVGIFVAFPFVMIGYAVVAIIANRRH